MSFRNSIGHLGAEKQLERYTDLVLQNEVFFRMLKSCGITNEIGDILKSYTESLKGDAETLTAF